MCVDDYEFRHFSSIREKICMRFIFINEWEDERIYPVNVAQFQANGKIPLCLILQHLQSKGLNIRQFNYYLPQFDIVINPTKPCQIKVQDLLNLGTKEIFFRYERRDKSKLEVPFDLNQTCDERHTVQDATFSIISNCCQKQSHEIQEEVKHEEISHQSNNSGESKQQKKKSKESQRTISDVILKVKIWRLLHDNKHISLAESAKIVGVSKKSLDDYFLVLRLGQLMNFNYLAFINKKMGDLRHFIKNQQSQYKGRLPKRISDFNLFKLVKNPQLQEILSEYENMKKIKPNMELQ